MQAYIHTSNLRPDGSRDSFATIAVDCQVKPLWWQEKGLSFTATGYGKRIPTRYTVRFNGRMRRVYACQYSNAGTLFIGKSVREGLIINHIED